MENSRRAFPRGAASFSAKQPSSDTWYTADIGQTSHCGSFKAGFNTMTSNSDDDLIAALSDFVNSMFGDYDGATRDELRAVLSSKLTQTSGTSLRELTGAVQNIRPFEAREKAELIAKTLSFGASNLANRRAWQRSGVVKTLKWFAVDDADMCGVCQAQREGRQCERLFSEKGRRGD